MIKSGGEWISSLELENLISQHPAVLEAAAIGVPDEVRGNVIYAYVILRAGVQPGDDLSDTLKEHIRHEIGPIAVPAKIEFVAALPKTRSGKIMRRVLRARALGLPEGDLSTLED